jgi:hypothetical protein
MLMARNDREVIEGLLRASPKCAIYGPPDHAGGTVHKGRAEAESPHAHFVGKATE